MDQYIIPCCTCSTQSGIEEINSGKNPLQLSSGIKPFTNSCCTCFLTAVHTGRAIKSDELALPVPDEISLYTSPQPNPGDRRYV